MGSERVRHNSSNSARAQKIPASRERTRLPHGTSISFCLRDDGLLEQEWQSLGPKMRALLNMATRDGQVSLWTLPPGPAKFGGGVYPGAGPITPNRAHPARGERQSGPITPHRAHPAPRAAAPVGVFSRGTTRISGSLSCGAREVRSHARGEGERVLALESREGTRASRRVEEGLSRSLSGGGGKTEIMTARRNHRRL